MKKLTIAISICIAFLFILQGTAFCNAKGHGDSRAVKKGILLVAFGSSEPEAQVSFTNIGAKVEKTFPGVPVYWAYTSHIIRKKMAKQGKILDSVTMALAKMKDKGFTHVAVQSLHTIPGEEFDGLVKDVKAFSNMNDGFTQILVGRPLLSIQEDVERVVDAILANIPSKRKPEDAVVLMGHGSHHPGNAYYSAVNWQIQLRDSNVVVGTVEGYPEMDTVLAFLKKIKAKKVWLMPFMSVAGDHAKNDMAGDEDDSWKVILKKNGYKCETILKGTAEFDNFNSIWVDHLKAVVDHLPK